MKSSISSKYNNVNIEIDIINLSLYFKFDTIKKEHILIEQTTFTTKRSIITRNKHIFNKL
jgi:hypothetical protein